MISAAAISVTASSSGGGLRRIRFGSSNSPYMYDINESVLVDDEAFGHIEDISDTEDFFRRLGGSSMMSMTSKSSSDDEANVISNDDAASHVAPTASIAATSAPTTKRPTILGVNPPIAAEIAVPTPSMAPMPSLPVPTMTPSSVPTPSCNLSNDERYDELQKELGVVSMSDLTDMSTPQGKAFNWIVSLDEMQLCPGDDRLIQRYVVVALYFSTNGDWWNDKTSWLNAATECEWAGLTCNLVGEIVSVELSKYPWWEVHSSAMTWYNRFFHVEVSSNTYENGEMLKCSSSTCTIVSTPIFIFDCKKTTTTSEEPYRWNWVDF